MNRYDDPIHSTERETQAMMSGRASTLAILVTATSIVAAHGQTSAPWPGSAPQAPAQAPWPGTAPQHAPAQAWPGTAPQQQAPAQAAWPGGAAAAPPPQQAWPSNAPQAPAGFGAPTGPPMGGPPGMNATQQECMREFTGYREEVEKRGIAAKAANEKHVPREEMCKLVTVYSGAEVKWIKFTETNMTKCGIPKEVIGQLKGVHSHTAQAQKSLCSAGPTQAAAPAAPTLSDALGTTRLPSQETEKRKPGGTMDTLTGNALSR
jgi:hypothetical protein